MSDNILQVQVGRTSRLIQPVQRLLTAGLIASAQVAAMAGDPYPYSNEWWAAKAQEPSGARQFEKDGKLWPPFPRPTGEKQPWVHRYHQAHYWPHPYVCDDRAFVNNILDQQAAGGWVTATTLHAYHFDPDTHELNSVGRDQLYWIVMSAPVQFRTVYIAQSMATAEDSLKQAHVEKTIQEMRPDAGIPVLLRVDRFHGRPAQEIDQLRRLELQSIPRPRLFTVGSANRSGGGGSGGGSGLSGNMNGLSGGSSGNNRN